MEQLKLNIHETLQEWLKDYIPTQELTHASNEICKAIENGTEEDMIYEMHSYLQRQDKEYIPLQTVNTKSITNNQLALAMNEIKKLIKTYRA